MADPTREALPEPLKVAGYVCNDYGDYGSTTLYEEEQISAFGMFFRNIPLVRLTDALSALESERQAHAAEVAALKMQLEAGPLYSTRLKARRYDWLRNEAHPDRDDTGLSVGEQDFNDWGKPFTRYLSGDALDAAIDQAIAKEKP